MYNLDGRKEQRLNLKEKGMRPNYAYSEDIIFYISEKRHQLFKREGDDLELCVEIPLLKALTGCTISVPLLGGEHMNLTLDEIIYLAIRRLSQTKVCQSQQNQGREET